MWRTFLDARPEVRVNSFYFWLSDKIGRRSDNISEDEIGTNKGGREHERARPKGTEYAHDR
jgi:hypothetical protein